MLEKKKIFLLNEEQKILVLLSFGRNKYIPKIIIPDFSMSIFEAESLQDLENFEYVMDFEKEKERLTAVNNHLKRITYISKTTYYAAMFRFNNEMQDRIRNFCIENKWIPDFWSIEEIAQALTYIYKNNKNVRKEIALEKSLYVLKRKLEYKEY